jgi:uncharacterized membrane protein
LLQNKNIALTTCHWLDVFSILRREENHFRFRKIAKGEKSMSSQPPYGNPPGGYPPPPGGYPPPPGGFPPPQGGPGGYPPPGGYGYGGGGSFPPPQDDKTKVGGLTFNVAAMLCYLPSCLCCINLIPCILWLATEPKTSRFVRFHALQGLLLWGIYFVVSLVLNILGRVLGAGAAVTSDDVSGFAFAGGSAIIGLIGLLVGLVFLVIHIMGMVKANQGQMWKLPVIGDIAEKNS